MTGLRWQKSTYSEGGADTCVEVALDRTGTLHLRESVTPATAITASPTALAALLDSVKSEAAPSV
ncbi:DUF397 domain-containing protein [Streptomyces blattellae]|uniref:DUF397 domain-containing protein n=1 Tax=Streptomyces blattellae TaxID=2569855 RepID=UPI0012BA1A2C|nr:DUF397 domain-containing protein [Streptomyces blattellae]